jgi:membrane protein
MNPEPGAGPAQKPESGPAALRELAAALAAPRDSFRVWGRDFLARLWKKLEQDNIFFLSGAIAFNVIVAVIPLLLASVGIAGLLIRSHYGADAAGQVVELVLRAFPPLSDPNFGSTVRDMLSDLLASSSGFVGVGTLIFIWVATRMVGTLRTALREIFDIQEDRGIIAGKIFDIQMVVAAGTLLTVNVVFTLVLQIVGNYGREFLGFDPERFSFYYALVLNAAAFGAIWFAFVLIYRYLPARRTRWRVALIAATFTGALFELLKLGFGWYVRDVANYRSAYGNFANLIIFLLWIYWGAVAFVIGGEVGQVSELRRVRRRQKERLH